MDKLFKKLFYCSCVGLLAMGILSTSALGQVLYIVPQGEDPAAYGDSPTVVDGLAARGSSLTFEVYIKGVSTPVRGASANFNCAASGGLAGSVLFQLGSAIVNTGNPNYLHRDATGLVFPVIDAGGCSPDPAAGTAFRYAVAAASEAFPADDPTYFAEFTLDVSSDALGTFVLEFNGCTGGAGGDECTGVSNLADIATATIPGVTSQPLFVAAAPLNDSCSTATSVSAGNFSASYDTTGATTDGPAGCPADGDAWYDVTVDCAGTIVADGGAGSQMAIYGPGAACIPGDGEEVACAAGSASFVGTSPGETYLVRLGSVGGGAIQGTVNIRCDPFCQTDADCTQFTDACNVGTCNPATGCFATPANDGASCDDGDRCTIVDTCDGGTCAGTADGIGDCNDRDSCSVDSCDAGAQTCSNVFPDGLACDPLGGDDCESVGGSCDDDGAGGFVCSCTSFSRPDLGIDLVGGSGPDNACVAPDNGIITVEVNLGPTPDDGSRFPAAPPVSGAQLFLSYDNGALQFVDIRPGGLSGSTPNNVFVFQLFESVNEAAGTIDYAVGTNPSSPGATTGTGTVAILQFRVLDPEACAADGGVSFRTHNPATRLAAPDATILPPRQHRQACTTDDDCILPQPNDGCFDGACTYDSDFDSGSSSFLAPLNLDGLGLDVTPPVVNCPFSGTVSVPASCDSATADLVWDAISGSDDCDGELECVFTSGGEFAEGGSFPLGSYDISCTAMDDCGNATTCSFTIESTGQQEVVVDVEVSPTVRTNIDRCLEFEVQECGEDSGGRDTIVTQLVTLGGPGDLRGHGTATFEVEPGNWECIEARDTQHSLGSTCLLECGEDGRLHAGFKGAPEFNESCHWLINGNLNSDPVIDIVDYAIWSNGTLGLASDRCDASNPDAEFVLDADINGDGVVDTFDFSFIVINIFENDKAGCDVACAGGAGGASAVQGRTSITARELARMGFTAEQIRKADVTSDGVVDLEDMAAYMNGDVPATPKSRASATSRSGVRGR